MKTKDKSVNIWGLEVEMQPVLKWADRIWKDAGHHLVITSARDSIHSAGSLHYYGYAVDMRASVSWGYDAFTIEKIADELRQVLGEGYQVIIHASHIHVEYDKAKPNG